MSQPEEEGKRLLWQWRNKAAKRHFKNPLFKELLE
jgi:hypothetical protein